MVIRPSADRPSATSSCRWLAYALSCRPIAGDSSGSTPPAISSLAYQVHVIEDGLGGGIEKFRSWRNEMTSVLTHGPVHIPERGGNRLFAMLDLADRFSHSLAHLFDD